MPRFKQNPLANTEVLPIAPPPPAVKPARERKAAGVMAGPQALNQAVWAICDVLRRAGVGSALRYVPELTWILFLRVLDEQEMLEREEAEALGIAYEPSLASPWRWQDWAAPYSEKRDAATTDDGRPLGWRRRELQEGKRGDLFAFVNGELLPHLRKLRDQPGASAKQKVISEIVSPVERVRVDTERVARVATAKAQGIEDAIYDIKAVNPRERKATDTRSPAQLLNAIDAKGREVEDALGRLRSLLTINAVAAVTTVRNHGH